MTIDSGAILYTRKNCPLCFALARRSARSARRHNIPLITMDVDDDQTLATLYGERVPVLELPGGGCITGGAEAGEVDEAFRLAAGAARRDDAGTRGRRA